MLALNKILKETLVEIDDVGICTVWLNREDISNAYGPLMAIELDVIFQTANTDDSVHLLILTGKGKRFCVGANLQMDNSARARFDSSRDFGGVASLSIFHCIKPVICVMHGAAVGIGITLGLPADLRIAEEDCTIGFIFANRGLSAEAASTYFLPRLVGNAKAFEWCMLARKFKAREEAQSGLFTKVVAKGQGYEEAKKMAREMLQNSSKVSLAYIKRSLWYGNMVDHPHKAHELESKLIKDCFSNEDVVEGFTSFMQKRPAHFKLTANNGAPQLDVWSEWKAAYPKAKL